MKKKFVGKGKQRIINYDFKHRNIDNSLKAYDKFNKKYTGIRHQIYGRKGKPKGVILTYKYKHPIEDKFYFTGEKFPAGQKLTVKNLNEFMKDTLWVDVDYAQENSDFVPALRGVYLRFIF